MWSERGNRVDVVEIIPRCAEVLPVGIRSCQRDVETYLRGQAAQCLCNGSFADNDELRFRHYRFDEYVDRSAALAGHGVTNDTGFERVEVAADADQARFAVGERRLRIFPDCRQRAATTYPTGDHAVGVE